MVLQAQQALKDLLGRLVRLELMVLQVQQAPQDLLGRLV
jgi:hypothetical protein